MPKISQGAFTNRMYQVGTYTLAATALAANVSAVSIAFNRADWLDPLSKIRLSLELSLDGGATWIPGGAFEADGGVFIDRFTGLPVTESVAYFSYPEPGNSNRKIRGTFEVIGVAFKTDATITTE